MEYINEELINKVAGDLNIKSKQVTDVLALLEGGATVPFIARYRKELTHGLDEEQIRVIQEQYDYQVNLKKRKEENNQIQQLTQQNEQLQQRLKEMQQQLKKYQETEQQLQQAQLQLSKEKSAVESEIQWYKAKTDRQYKEASIEEQKRRTNIEINQQYDGNPYNDRIRQINESTL